MGNGAFLRPTCLQNRRRLPCLACRTSQTERRSIFCWRLFTLPQMKTLFPTANGNPSRPAFRRGNKRKMRDRKSTRLNSSHDQISYAVFCLKKKKDKLDSSSVSMLAKEISISGSQIRDLHIYTYIE